MKKHTLVGSICTLLLTALSASAATAQDASTASILFSRTNWRAVDSSHDTVLYRVKPDGSGVTALTPVTYHVDYRGGSWSPTGSSVVYEQAPQATTQQSQLFVVDRQGGAARQITTGSGLHTQASWGPNSATIAFLTTDSGPYCLATVRADGTQQHTLFCPPRTPQGRADMNLSKPQWTGSGKSVFVEVGNYGPGLDPQWYSRVYRINVYTGAVVLLAEYVFGADECCGDPQKLAIAPDGKHGIYADAFGQGEMERADFAAGTLTPLGTVGLPISYSRDGTQVAFNQQEASSPHYSRVFVMSANGSHVQPALTSPDPDTSYSFGDWSSDGSRVLINAVGNDRILQIATLATGTASDVTKGTADKGAWYHW